MGFFGIFKKKKKYELSEAVRKWNKLWKLWAQGKIESPYAELMTYQAEVNNGGHGQYFTNVENTGDLKKEMSALEGILSEKLIENLKKAYNAYLLWETNETDEEADVITDQCDDVFYENEAEINGKLKEYASKIEL